MLRVLVLVAALFVTSAAQADNWVASKLRGGVFVAQGQNWVPLKRGDNVLDGQDLQTTASGHVELTRGTETISLSPNTQVQVRQTRGGTYTKLDQPFGQITIADDHTVAPHFEVDTPYLVAVVKGTVFTVNSDSKKSRVDVLEGAVQISDRQAHTSAIIVAGQHASVGVGQPLIVGEFHAGTSAGQNANTAGISAAAPTPPASDAVSTSDDSKSDNGNGNGGTPGNGGQNNSSHGNSRGG